MRKKKTNFQRGKSKLTVEKLENTLKKQAMTPEQISEQYGCSPEHAKWVALVDLKAKVKILGGDVYFAIDEELLHKLCNSNFGDGEACMPSSKSDLSDFYEADECETNSSQNPSKQNSGKNTSDVSELHHPHAQPSQYTNPPHNLNFDYPLHWYEVIRKIKEDEKGVLQTIIELLQLPDAIPHKDIGHAAKCHRSTVSKWIKWFKEQGVVVEKFSIYKDIKGSYAKRKNPREYEVIPRFIGMYERYISPNHDRACRASENGWFRVHRVQRVFELVNFDKSKVNVSLMLDKLLLNTDFDFVKSSKKNVYATHEFVHRDYPEYRIILCNRRFYVVERNKYSLLWALEDFPDKADDLYLKLVNGANGLAKEFAIALNSFAHYPDRVVSVKDVGWAGQNSCRGNGSGEAQLPHVAYIAPDNIISRAVEVNGGHFYVKGLGWYTDGSIKPYDELEFANDARSRGGDKANEFIGMMDFFNNPKVQNFVLSQGASGAGDFENRVIRKAKEIVEEKAENIKGEFEEKVDQLRAESEDGGGYEKVYEEVQKLFGKMEQIEATMAAGVTNDHKMNQLVYLVATFQQENENLKKDKEEIKKENSELRSRLERIEQKLES